MRRPWPTGREGVAPKNNIMKIANELLFKKCNLVDSYIHITSVLFQFLSTAI